MTNKMKKVLFIDRDGTIIQETDDEKIETIEKLDFLPEALYYLKKIKEETDNATDFTPFYKS